MAHPLYVTVTGQVQNPSLMVPVNVSVTMPVTGSWLHVPVGVPVTLFRLQLGNSSAWSMLQLMGGPSRVHPKNIPKLPELYPQVNRHGPLRDRVPVITPAGQPVLHVVFGGMGVEGPAVNCMVAGRARRPQQG